jgi:ABC-type antimicrobial peptide transport system permease subunit
VNGRTARLLGTSLRKRWLQQFFVHPEAGFIASEDALIAQSRDDAFCQLHRPTMITIGDKSFDVPITPVPSDDVPLCVIPLFHPLATTIILPGIVVSRPLPAKTPTVFVPSEFLAQLHALNRNEVAYDPALRLFVPLTQENLYYKGRFYARSLDDVPKIDALLHQAGFTTQSERTRIEEIQGYARVLRLLVHFVGSIVVLCGIVTLGVVLSDNTARKRGALGVLRLMGFGRGDLLVFVVARALLLGVIGGLVLIPLSYIFAELLTRLGALCELHLHHLVIVFALAIGSSLIGICYPALQTSRQDPMSDIGGSNLH